MSLEYRIYANDGAGGPVDLSSPVATVSGTTWDAPPLAAGADATYLVRVRDASTGLEEENADARVRIRLAADCLDASALPNAPIGLTVRARSGSSARVSWLYSPAGQGAAPVVFRVYAGTTTPDYSTPAATAAYSPNSPGRPYEATLTDLSAGPLVVVVRAANAAGEETNTAAAATTIPAAGPSAVVGLAASLAP